MPGFSILLLITSVVLDKENALVDSETGVGADVVTFRPIHRKHRGCQEGSQDQRADIPQAKRNLRVETRALQR